MTVQMDSGRSQQNPCLYTLAPRVKDGVPIYGLLIHEVAASKLPRTENSGCGAGLSGSLGDQMC